MPSISQYLKSIGVKTPYTNDLTEAQIGEKNKANPLSGFGFQSAQEKQALLDRQRQYEQALNDQQAMQMQGLLAQMRPQQQIGHYAGKGVMGIVDQLRNKDQPQQAPQAQTNDPQLDRFNELAAEVGPDQAKVMLGQELMQSGNQSGAAMLQEGQAAIQKAQTGKLQLENDQLSNENLKGQIADRKSKPNNVVNLSGEHNGKPITLNAEVVGQNPDGSNKYRIISQGMKGSVTGAPGDFGKTNSQEGKAAVDFETTMQSTENALDTNDKMQKIITENPNAVGMQGALAAGASDLVYGIKGLSSLLGTDNDNKLKLVMASEDPVGKYKDVFDKMSGTAIQNNKLQALLLDQAYLMATAGGQKATDADVRNQLKILGGKINNPKAFQAVLQQNRELLVDRLGNAGRNTGEGGKPLADMYKDRIKSISDRKTYGDEWVTVSPGVRRKVKR